MLIHTNNGYVAGPQSTIRFVEETKGEVKVLGIISTIGLVIIGVTFFLSLLIIAPYLGVGSSLEFWSAIVSIFGVIISFIRWRRRWRLVRLQRKGELVVIPDALVLYCKEAYRAKNQPMPNNLFDDLPKSADLVTWYYRNRKVISEEVKQKLDELIANYPPVKYQCK